MLWGFVTFGGNFKEEKRHTMKRKPPLIPDLFQMTSCLGGWLCHTEHPALSDSVTGTCVTRGLRLFIILLHRPDDPVFGDFNCVLISVCVYLCERQLCLFISLLHLTDNWEKPVLGCFQFLTFDKSITAKEGENKLFGDIFR